MKRGVPNGKKGVFGNSPSIGKNPTTNGATSGYFAQSDTKFWTGVEEHPGPYWTPGPFPSGFKEISS
jgi:hypothetical protein